MNPADVAEKTMEIRNRYHELDKQLHGSIWSAEEDTLAFLIQVKMFRNIFLSSECHIIIFSLFFKCSNVVLIS